MPTVTDGDLERKVGELMALEQRINDYETTLLKEGFKIAKEKGIHTTIGCVYPADKIDNSNIFIHEDHEGNVKDVSPIVDLAKDSLPKLYEDYKTAMEQHEQGREELKDMIERAD